MKLHSAYVVASDPDALSKFYEAVFGQPPKINVPQTWIQFGLGSAGFALSSKAEASPEATGTTAVFETADLAEATRTIEKLGGRLVQSRDMGSHGKTASFRDPEGNLFQLLQKS
jgi:predicted enzyme related to lactoylglutathione lyase